MAARKTQCCHINKYLKEMYYQYKYIKHTNRSLEQNIKSRNRLVFIWPVGFLTKMQRQFPEERLVFQFFK